MQSSSKSLGIMRPSGGGDPAPLNKDEILIGRRRTCDIQLDFENVSGKHCVLRFHKGTWYVRDLGSTNGTTVNGQRLSSEHGLMPDDELGIATHKFYIDYDPIAPSSLVESNHLLEEEMIETPRARSLMELAGIESDSPSRRPSRPHKAPERMIHKPKDDAEFDDVVPAQFDESKNGKNKLSDDDFLRMIQGAD